MKIVETDKPPSKLHEINVTIDDSEGYAEIVEVCGTGKGGAIFVIVTSVTAIDPDEYFPDLFDRRQRD